MPLTYESIGMPERGTNISDPFKHKNSLREPQKSNKKNVRDETVDKKFTRNNKKRNIETTDDGVRKRVVIGADGKAKTVDVSTFNKQHEIAKSNRKKEKAKLYKKKNKQKKKNKRQIPVVDDEKILKECTEYLNKWKDDRPNWKFEKLKQIKLVHNMFHPKRHDSTCKVKCHLLIDPDLWRISDQYPYTLVGRKVSNEIFPIFIEYIAGSAGHMRNLVSIMAMKIVKEMEKWCEMSEEEREETSQKPDETKYNRARQIVQTLDE